MSLYKKSIVLDAGHGLTRYKDSWKYQRDELNGIIEDLKTIELAGYVKDYLHRGLASDFYNDDIMYYGHNSADDVKVTLTRPVSSSMDGMFIGDSGGPRYKEAALYYIKDILLAGHPFLFEVMDKAKTDYGRDLFSRTFLVDTVQPDVAVSLHINASSNPNAHGVEVWYYPFDVDSKELATFIYSELLNYPQFDGDRGIKGEGKGWEITHAKKLVWLREIKNIPHVLVEFLFYSNQGDVRMLKDEESMRMGAHSIANGILKYIEYRRGRL